MMQPTHDNPYAIIVCPRCFGTGYILTRHRETCPDCNGSGRLTEIKARELDRQENEAVENALAQRINELEAERDALASENARLREALGLTDERIKVLENTLTEILSSSLVKNPWDGSCAICGGWHGYDHEKDAECELGRAAVVLDGEGGA